MKRALAHLVILAGVACLGAYAIAACGQPSSNACGATDSCGDAGATVSEAGPTPDGTVGGKDATPGNEASSGGDGGEDAGEEALLDPLQPLSISPAVCPMNSPARMPP